MILDLCKVAERTQVFELTETIEADLERIEDLAKYENEHDINSGITSRMSKDPIGSQPGFLFRS